MNHLNINTNNSDEPLIDFNAENGVLNIQGSSYPEDAEKFYKPVLEWLQSYSSENKPLKTTVNIELIYCNSASSKMFYQIFEKFDQIRKNRFIDQENRAREIEVNWIYDEDNDNAIEMGEDFIEDFEKLKINLVEK